MLICFGAAWPFSIYKSLKTKDVRGKSLAFMIIVFAGYVSGIMHKIFYNYDAVIWLYMFNGLMVVVDISLYIRYKNRSPIH